MLKLNKTVYKMVAHEANSNQLCSAYMSYSKKAVTNLCLSYSTEWITVPIRNSLLFIFNDYKKAKEWMNTRLTATDELWEAKTSKVITPKPIPFKIILPEILDTFNSFWECYESRPKLTYPKKTWLPEGTRLCPELILTKKLCYYTARAKDIDMGMSVEEAEARLKEIANDMREG